MYDPLMASSKAAINVSKLSFMNRQVIADEPQYIKAGGSVLPTTLTIDKDVLIIVGDSFFKTVQTTLTPSNLDIGTSFMFGNDYYIYICDPTNGNDLVDENEVYKISLSSSYPAGWNSSNSRKIGGFHYGAVRNVDSYYRPVNNNRTLLGADWESSVYTGIVPNSIWTLLHKPRCNPEGMVYLGNGLWGDIYLASDNEANGLQSKYNTYPLTGAENLNWYGFVERATLVNKRLATYSEYCAAALGSPAGQDNNLYAWTASSNTTRNNCGTILYATSSYNVRDLVGNVWKWIDETVDITTSNSVSEWAGVKDALQEGGILTGSCGDIHGYQSFRALAVGGNMNSSTNAGRRTVSVKFYPWDQNPNIGAWCVCESA